MPPDDARPGHLRPAPENHLDAATLDGARRRFLAGAAGVAAAFSAASIARADDPAILQAPEHSRTLGQPVAARGYGAPSVHEAALQRRTSRGLTRTSLTPIAFAPLQGLFGIVTPSGLHFERHHAGWHDIDPAGHRLMIHGLVKRARVYTMDEVMRLPSVSRFHFIECGANSGMEWGNAAVPTSHFTHGMLSCSEFTGVPPALLLEDAGVDRDRGRFVVAEGADGSGLTRTIPMEMALDDVLVVYGQNGEMLRPENGYPLRLLVPGVQGVSSVKWLRRLEVGDATWNAREEALHYIDLMPGGIHRQYTWVRECKSVITSPFGRQVLLDRGYHEITGLAWSGRGRVRAVDVYTDGGITWSEARLQTPVMDKCLTRFRAHWNWDGGPVILQSRAMDVTGYVQPTLSQLRAVRGTRSIYHNNAIQSWRVNPNGEVDNVQVG
jgi:sulfane dehydrogenase subunit SoxC